MVAAGWWAIEWSQRGAAVCAASGRRGGRFSLEARRVPAVRGDLAR